MGLLVNMFRPAVEALLLSPLLMCLACSPAGGNFPPHPTDAALEKNFREHRGEFEELLSMYAQDSQTVVAITHNLTRLDSNRDWPRPDAEIGISAERWNEYRRLFKLLDINEGVSRVPETGVLLFSVSSSGTALDSVTKGYAYSQRKLEPTTESLDQIPPNLLTGKPVYKRLEGNWYLYFW